MDPGQCAHLKVILEPWGPGPVGAYEKGDRDGHELTAGQAAAIAALAAEECRVPLSQVKRVAEIVANCQGKLAARNVAWATVMPVMGLNAYDILRHDRLVIDAVALEPAQDELEGEEQ